MNNFEKLQITEHLIKRAFIGRAIKSFRPSMKDIMKIRRATTVANNPAQLHSNLMSSYVQKRPYLDVQSQIGAREGIDDLVSTAQKGKGFNGFYTPYYNSVYLKPGTGMPGSARTVRRHEMLHALQHQLPFSKTTLGGKIGKLPFLGKRVDDLAHEMEAFMYQNPGKKWSGLKTFNRLSADYAKDYAGRSSAPAMRAYSFLVNKPHFVTGPAAAFGTDYLLSSSRNRAQNNAPAPTAPTPPGTVFVPLPPKNNLVSDQ